MQTIKRFITLLLCALLSAPAAWAQDPQRDQTQHATMQDVLIIIGQEQVRFTAQKAVQEMQLQIFNQAGELVHDSGVGAGPEINWPLQGTDGQPLKSGLYAYTLSIKEQGAEAARVRRGHFIVDRAKDRENADKLWITSQNESGVGTDLTVARGENSTIAGVSAPPRSEDQANREANELKRAGEANGGSEAQAVRSTTAAAAAGAVNQVAKFTTTADLGGSDIYEVSGRVGIGTSTPTNKLTVKTNTNTFGFSHTDGTINLTSWIGGSGSSIGAWLGTTTNHDLHFFTRNGQPQLTVTKDGFTGVGTTTPSQRLDVNGNINYGQLTKLDVAASPYATIRAHDLLLGHPARSINPRRALVDGGANGLHINFDGDWTHTVIGSNLTVKGYDFRLGHPSRLGREGLALVDNGAKGLYINFARDWAQTVIEGDLSVKGRTSTHVLEITGGADFAENFDINAAETEGATATAEVQPGMVVSIDPAAPGKLMLSAQAYDYQVAGIVSGAGGVKPGMILSQEGTLANGKYPVALSGRVYCWADASNGPINPGDLLTTSSTPGHAMKAADRAKAQGAIIGKAMTGLKEGKGLVLVLVTLQ